MNNTVRIQKLTLNKLLSFLEKNRVAIPEFQRGYVWKVQQVKQLFDSLIKGYPVGTFIIWKTNQQIGQRSLFSTAVTAKGNKFLVLDGQQRLLSLFYLCKQDTFQKSFKDEFTAICETHDKHIVEFEKFYIMGGKRPRLEYEQNHGEDLVRGGLFKQINKSYKFPVIITKMNDLSRAVEIFERINQAGTAIATESIFISEAFNKHANIGKLLREWRHKEKNWWASRIDPIVFIHAFATIIQLEGIGDDDEDLYDEKYVRINLRMLKKIAGRIRNEKSKIYEREFKMVLRAVSGAAHFLQRELGIDKVNELPSQPLITILSTFFYYEPKPSKRKINKLLKWFWRASFGRRYVGSDYNENVAVDPFKIKELAKRGKSPRIPKAILEKEDLLDTDISTGRATIKNTVRLMFWNRGPLWIDGSPIMRTESTWALQKKEDDHFYAHDFYKKSLLGPEVNSVLNMVFLPKTENASKGSLLPSEQLSALRKKLDTRKNDERHFFEQQFLPFDSISDIKRKEAGLRASGGGLAKKKLVERFEWFLEKRYQMFKKEMYRLQD